MPLRLPDHHLTGHPVPDSWRTVLRGPQAVPLKTALWQAPLVAVLALEIGWFLVGFWVASLLVSLLTQRWQHWAVQLLLLTGLIAAAVALVPVRSADFFILILIALLPMTWRLDSADDPRPLSPAGLTPTIFLVGAVFIYQIQFIVLLLLVIWLLSFLLWYCTALTGFRLDSITLRWVPVLAVSTIIAGVIVLLFTLVPRIDTGFIPGFADPKQKIALTDEVSPGGMSDLLADTDLAFKAVPAQRDDNRPRYWRVFVLNEESGGNWRRVRGENAQVTAAVTAHVPTHRYDLLAEEHDMSVLPVPGWPAGWDSDLRLSRWGEAVMDRKTGQRRVRVVGADTAPNLVSTATDSRRNKRLSGANPRLIDWAQRTRQTVASDAAFLELVLAQFGDEFAYDTTIALPQTDALDSFFFDSKRGYCSYFATAMATILRAAGIEANVVLGYLGGEWNQYGQFWSVLNADAHAWVEARLDGGGWQRIDPTLLVMSAADVNQVELRGGALQIRAPDAAATQHGLSLLDRAILAREWVEALNTRLTLSIMDYGQGNQSDGGERADYTALIILVLSLGLTGVAVFAAVMAWNRRKSRAARLEARFETVLLPLLAEGPRRPGETVLALAARAIADLPDAATTDTVTVSRAIRQLANTMTAWRYAPNSAPNNGPNNGTDVRAMGAQIKSLRKTLRGAGIA